MTGRAAPCGSGPAGRLLDGKDAHVMDARSGPRNLRPRNGKGPPALEEVSRGSPGKSPLGYPAPPVRLFCTAATTVVLSDSIRDSTGPQGKSSRLSTPSRDRSEGSSRVNPQAKKAILARIVRAIARDGDVETLLPTATFRVAPKEGVGEEDSDQVSAAALRKIADKREHELTDREADVVEAIILPEGRPVSYITDGRYTDLGGIWAHLNEPDVRFRIEPLFASIGRVELPRSTRLPYAGTGFVVGPNLLLTNRHIAELFTDGLGDHNLVYRPGDAAINFKREKGETAANRSATLQVQSVVLIHPFWDAALLRVSGLPPQACPLPLAVASPDDLVGREIAAVGYPARDERNDLDVQDRIFERTYGVKRFQPGYLRRRARIGSFENTVSAMTHDSSTLGGNSGSALIDIATAEVVGLHFAGVYLEANYAVPTFELARDTRVVRHGLNFTGVVPPTREWNDAWARADANEHSNPKAPAPKPAPTQHAALDELKTATWTIPIRVSVSVGRPECITDFGTATPSPSLVVSPVAEVERLVIPVIYPNLEDRAGYNPTFLDEEVPLPGLTQLGQSAAATLNDGTCELKYHHFSLVMHRERRLAIFTAGNADWRDEAHRINGHKPTRRELTELGERDLEQWATDPRIRQNEQLPDVFFTRDQGAFDKGHLFRRDDAAWGDTFEDMQKANGDTYHTTNCSPQVATFNQAPKGDKDNWGDLETVIERQTRAERTCLFSGPVLDPQDPVFQGRDVHGNIAVQIPRRYWKIVVARGETLGAYGFVLEQDLTDVPLEFTVPKNWKAHMLSIADIEGMLGGLLELTWFKQHDQFNNTEGALLRAHLDRD